MQCCSHELAAVRIMGGIPHFVQGILGTPEAGPAGLCPALPCPVWAGGPLVEPGWLRCGVMGGGVWGGASSRAWVAASCACHHNRSNTGDRMLTACGPVGLAALAMGDYEATGDYEAGRDHETRSSYS